MKPRTPNRRIDFPCPPGAERRRCGCGADLYWAEITRKDGTRAWHPLDAGSVVFHGGTRRMESHYAHCPLAAEHRRRPGATDRARITDGCHALGCTRLTHPSNGLCCRECWRLVPPSIRAWVLRTAEEWQAGRRREAGAEERDRLTARVREAAHAAQVVVAKRRAAERANQGDLFG